ncbi:MAG: transposase, partial [Caldilineaceae bacterium]|nr:transposase [Caldilineaceae bacterium]
MIEQFEIDWEQQQVRCPQGKVTTNWNPGTDSSGSAVIYARFRRQDCHGCSARKLCTKSLSRRIGFRPRAQYMALQAARQRLHTEEGNLLYNRRVTSRAIMYQMFAVICTT